MNRRITRREWLLGAGAGAATLGLLGARARAGEDGIARNLVLVVAAGGWDTTYALDPKPGLSTIDAPAGDVQTFGDLPVLVHDERPAVGAFFERYGDITAVVNGVQTQSIVHADCSKRVLTGTASDLSPDVGAIAAFEHGNTLAAPYLVLGQLSYTGPYASIAARAGTVNQLGTLFVPAYGYPTEAYPGFDPDSSEERLIRRFVVERAEREFERRGGGIHNRARMEDFVNALVRGDRLAELADFGDFEYTRDLVIQSSLAADALEQGLSWAVQIELGGWDTHENNARQSGQYEAFFTGLRLFIDDLSTRPGRRGGETLLDETVVAVLSEMGRTPRLNAAAGKDHWPVTSAMVIGAGVHGGRVIGKSSDLLQAESIDLTTGLPSDEGKQLQYGNLAAGLLELCGVDASAYLPGSEPLRALTV